MAALLRIVNISGSPPALYGDELTTVYDTYSVLKTGHDQLGDFLPLTFKMSGGRPAGYVYFSIPFVSLFGPSAPGVRMLSIISGLGIVIVLYLLSRHWFDEKVAAITALFAALSPWDINLSRGGYETHFALFLSVLGIFTFIVARQEPETSIFRSERGFIKSKFQPWLLVIFAICFSIAVHTYPTYKLTIPLILLVLIFTSGNLRQYLQGKYLLPVIISALILLVGFSLVAVQSTTTGSDKRFLAINIFGQQELQEKIVQKINGERAVSSMPVYLLPLFHNKYIENSLLIGEGYLSHFSLDFLFIHGDRNPRHNMSLMGQLYLIEIVLLVIGLAFIALSNRRLLILLLGWLLIAPLPAALMLEPHALRSSLMLPPLIIFSATGLYVLVSHRKEKGMKFLLWTVVFIFFIQFTFFINRIFFLTSNELSRFWSFPAKIAAQYIMSNKDNFDYVLVSDRIDNIEYAYPVYSQTDPSIIIAQNKQRDRLGKYEFKRIDNVYIGHIPESEIESFIGGLNKKVLFIGSPEEAKSLDNYQLHKGLDALPAFVTASSEF